MKMRSFPLTWFDFYAWAKGPVAPEVYEIINGAFGEYVTSKRTSEDKRVVNPLLGSIKIDNSLSVEFSTSEIVEIKKLLELYSTQSADELSELTHLKDLLWTRTVENNHIAFDKNNTKSNEKLDLRKLFSDKDSRIVTYENARWTMELHAKVSSNQDVHNDIQFQVVTPSQREPYRIPVYSPIIP